MTEPTPNQRMTAGYDEEPLTETERNRLASIAMTNDPEILAKLRAAERRLIESGQPVHPNTRTALGYAENAAAAAKATEQNNDK